jgi:SWI/SNF-related matrix-associated actin-dependent regulator of chromatin subfamily A-like protein 1
MGNEKPTLTFRNGCFELRGSSPFELSKSYAVQLWQRDKSAKVWRTENLKSAALLREYADGRAKNEIDRRAIQKTPWQGSVRSPNDVCVWFPDGLMPEPDQIKAVRWAATRRNSYIAADPGKGKSVIAACLINTVQPDVAVILTPPHARLNITLELKKWARLSPLTKIYVLPDSIVAREEARQYLKEKMVGKWHRLLIVDEAHRFKLSGGATSARTRALLGRGNFVGEFNQVVYMSGSPMPNRPMELFPILKRSAPEVIRGMTRFEYGMRYCAGFQDSDGYWNFKGASNTDELFSRMKEKFMLRIRKTDGEYGDRKEQIVYLGGETSREFSKLDKSLLAGFSPDKPELGGEEMSRYRHLLGIEKVIPSLKFLRDELHARPSESFLVFAHHKEVVTRLLAGLKGFHPLSITGDDTAKRKEFVVRLFQHHPKHRVLIGNIAAAGTAFTLTKANRVVMVEYSWSPEENRQCGDRVHRRGQKKDVLIQYLCFKNSLDRVVLETNLNKRRVIDAL